MKTFFVIMGVALIGYLLGYLNSKRIYKRKIYLQKLTIDALQEKIKTIKFYQTFDELMTEDENKFTLDIKDIFGED